MLYSLVERPRKVAHSLRELVEWMTDPENPDIWEASHARLETDPGKARLFEELCNLFRHLTNLIGTAERLWFGCGLALSRSGIPYGRLPE